MRDKNLNENQVYSLNVPPSIAQAYWQLSYVKQSWKEEWREKFKSREKPRVKCSTTRNHLLLEPTNLNKLEEEERLREGKTCVKDKGVMIISDYLNFLLKKIGLFIFILYLHLIYTTDQEEKDCHRPMSAERMLKNHARACRKLALPLQPYVFDDFFCFPTD